MNWRGALLKFGLGITLLLIVGFIVWDVATTVNNLRSDHAELYAKYYDAFEPLLAKKEHAASGSDLVFVEGGAEQEPWRYRDIDVFRWYFQEVFRHEVREYFLQQEPTLTLAIIESGSRGPTYDPCANALTFSPETFRGNPHEFTRDLWLHFDVVRALGLAYDRARAQVELGDSFDCNSADHRFSALSTEYRNMLSSLRTARGLDTSSNGFATNFLAYRFGYLNPEDEDEPGLYEFMRNKVFFCDQPEPIEPIYEGVDFDPSWQYSTPKTCR